MFHEVSRDDVKLVLLTAGRDVPGELVSFLPCQFGQNEIGTPVLLDGSGLSLDYILGLVRSVWERKRTMNYP